MTQEERQLARRRWVGLGGTAALLAWLLLVPEVVHGAPTLTPPNAAQSGEPGATVTYALTLTNSGLATADFDVSVSVILGAAWTTTVSPASVTGLAAGGSTAVQVRVSIPTSATDGLSSTARVTVESTSDATMDTTDLTTTVQRLLGDATWDDRFSPTSRGTLLLATPAVTPDTVRFYDPFFDSTIVRTVQTKADGGDMNLQPDSSFSLGSGAGPNQVIGAWRRGTDFAWVWVQTIGSATLGTPQPVTATGRPGASPTFNPEWVSIADGCVFMVLQFVVGAANVKDVYRIDPATGVGTSVTGSLSVSADGGGAARVVTSGCQAAFVFDHDDLNTAAGKALYFFDGSALTQVDSGDLEQFHMARGRIAYTKTLSGATPQVFGWDRASGAPPVQFSSDTTGFNESPTTDGQHIAWLHIEGTTENVMLGGLLLSRDPDTRHHAADFHDSPLQFHRGQLAWRDTLNRLMYQDGAGLRALDLFPTTAFDTQWLADGFVALRSATLDTNVLAIGTPPVDPAPPAPPMVVRATPGDGQATVEWDRIVGASSYSLYLALEPGLTKDNYLTKRGGRKLTGVTPPVTVTGLRNGQIYSFVVTTVAGGTEGSGSRVVRAPLPTGMSWAPGAGTGGVAFHTVAADALDPLVAYAGDSTTVHKSTDGGATWTALGGGIAGRDIRALAARGGTVYAVTAAGDILRSVNGGGSWAVVADGTAPRGPRMSLVIDPLNPGVLYAGNIELPVGAPGDAFVLKSTTGGATWSHVPSGTEFGFGDLIAHAIALDPLTPGRLHVGGSGAPLARSTDGGASWFGRGFPVPNIVFSLALDPASPTVMYAGTRESEGNGAYKGYGDRTWRQKNTGLPSPPPQINALLFDAGSATFLQAGTSAGYFFSLDGGEGWTALNAGLTANGQQVNALAVTPGGRVIAATDDGLFVLDFSLPAGIAGIATGAGGRGGPHVRGFTGTGASTVLNLMAYHPSFTGGVRVAPGDVDGDGAVDLITGPGPGGGPHVRVLAGPAATTVLAEFFAYAPTFTGGVFVAAGDLDGDGRAEIVTGPGAGGGPHIRAFRRDPSGSLTEIASFFAYNPLFTGGVTVAVCDVDGDGRADIVTGAGAGGGPHVQVFSGATGGAIASFFAYAAAFTGGVFVACADVDGDGRGDIITGPGAGGGPHVRVFRRNPDGSLAEIGSFFAYDPAFTGGVFVTGAR